MNKFEPNSKIQLTTPLKFYSIQGNNKKMDQPSSSISEPSRILHEHELIKNMKTTHDNDSTNGKTFELYTLNTRLKNGLDKRNIKNIIELCERIKRIEERIGQFEEENRIDEVEREKKYLNELKQLKTLNEELVFKTTFFLSQTIDKLNLTELEYRLKYELEKYNIKDVTSLPVRIRRTKKRILQYEEEERIDIAEQEKNYLQDLKQIITIIEEIVVRKSTSNNQSLEKTNQKTIKYKNDMLMNIENLEDDLIHTPDCAERTIIELLIYCQKQLQRDSIVEKLKELRAQIQNEERFSKQFETFLQDLDRYVRSEDYSSMTCVLMKVLKIIRPLYLQEIQRLVKTSRETAVLINNKDIILLVGMTGSGKSTTVQFLSGAKMKKTQVEIVSGHVLQHITTDDSIQNAELHSVTTSPLSRSETRCILPITIQLKKILGVHETGEIIVCDAPGFDDTAGPEIDIVNSVGVIEAVRNCNSVKIFALSSYRSLGDRGEGIEQLARMLNDMIDGIEKQFHGIFYAFTKYPSTTDIHTLLRDIKNSRVDKNSYSQLNNDTVLPVLRDMIEKTKDSVEKIDPINDDPKSLIRKLKEKTDTIVYPKNVFRCSISERTKRIISNQLVNYRQSIMCAMKYKNINLLMYYLNNFKALNELIQQDFVSGPYTELILLINETIKGDRMKVMEKFCRYLTSLDQLKQEDLEEFQRTHKYIEEIENLRVYSISVDNLIETMLYELEKRYLFIKEQELYDSSVEIYLHNVFLLKNSFKQLESYYVKICQEFSDRFELTLGQSISELISANDFKQISERFFLISQCLPILNIHLNGKIEEKYHEMTELVLKHLNSFSQKQSSVLRKRCLNNEDIQTLTKYMNLLKTARDTFFSQNQIPKTITSISVQLLENSKKIYEEFIDKIIIRFTNTVSRVEGLFNAHQTCALGYIEESVVEMELIRTLSDIQSKIDEQFYTSINHIRSYMERCRDEVRNSLQTLDDASGTVNFHSLAQILARLKKTKWIDRIDPETYDYIMDPIRKELKEHADQLESNLKQLDLSLARPQNVVLAGKIIEKIESMKILEDFILEYRERMYLHFSQSIDKVFKDIEKTFTLEDKTTDVLQQQINDLEKIKSEYDQLYPARNYLRQSGYLNIDIFNQKIEHLKDEQKRELDKLEIENSSIKFQLNQLKLIDQKYKELVLLEESKNFVSRIVTQFSRHETEENAFLKKNGYSNIDELNKIIIKTDEAYNKLRKSIESKRIEFTETLTSIESVRNQYNEHLKSKKFSKSEIDFLREKNQQSYESLEKMIEEKKKILDETENYFFLDKLDVRFANDALIYINNCATVSDNHVKNIAEKKKDLLIKYLEEYSDFIDKKIERNFDHITCIEESNPTPYAEAFKFYLRELSSFEKYTLVFNSMHVAEKIESCRQKFSSYHCIVDTKMELYKISGNNQERKNLSIIIKALICLDDFCTNISSEKKFQVIYNRYQIEIAQESRNAYDKAIDYIKKQNYVDAEYVLHDIVENMLGQRLWKQINNELKCSVGRMMKNTESYAQDLEQHDDCQKLNENITKLRFVLNHHCLNDHIDEQTRNHLQNFENKINEILSTMILKRIENITVFIDHDHFLQAEQWMKDLIIVHRRVAEFYKSTLVDIKIDGLRARLNNPQDDILRRYDLEDIQKYSARLPTNLLDQLKNASSGGYAKYAHVYDFIIENIQTNFKLAIDQVRDSSFGDRSKKVYSIKSSFSFLPMELKTIFQSQVNQLNVD